MVKQATTSPPIFIASTNAEEYAKLLRSKLGNAIAVNLAGSEADVQQRYSGEPVVLGRPDFLIKLLQKQPPVKWVQSTWAGVNLLVDLDFQDYQLTGVKGVFGPQMVEFVLAYMLAHEVKIRQRYEQQQKRCWDTTLSGTLSDKVVGLMGTGSIGCHVASTLEQFGLIPIGFNTTGATVQPFRQIFTIDSINEFLQQCDYLVCVLPDAPATTNLLNADTLAHLQSSALLINVGRGNLIDESALSSRLRNGYLAGAVLDVFRQEPLSADSPLWDVPNLLVTGHIAAVSQPPAIAQLFIQNYRLFRKNEPLHNLVDFNKGY